MEFVKFIEKTLDKYESLAAYACLSQGFFSNIEPDIDTLPYNVLELAKEDILKLPAFKNTKRINFIPLPTYLATLDDEPVLPSREDFLGQETKTLQLGTYVLDVNRQDDPIFDEVVDLYSIRAPKKYLTNNPLISTPGVWSFPARTDEKSFTTLREMRIVWNPEQMQDAMAGYNFEMKDIKKGEEKIVERILSQVREALTSGPNIPYERQIFIRCSSRSIIKQEAIEN